MLTGWIAAVIGIIIVVFSLNRLIREIRKGGIPDMEDQSFSDTFYALLNRTDQLGEDMDDINQTFYETVERLEKRIELLERKLSSAQTLNRPRKEAIHEPVIPPEKDIEPSPAPPEIEHKPLAEAPYTASEIRRLLNEGKDCQQVAKELNLGVGEVELIRRLKTNTRSTK